VDDEAANENETNGMWGFWQNKGTIALVAVFACIAAAAWSASALAVGSSLPYGGGGRFAKFDPIVQQYNQSGENIGLGHTGLREGGVGGVDISLGDLDGAGCEDEGEGEDREKCLEVAHSEKTSGNFDRKKPAGLRGWPLDTHDVHIQPIHCIHARNNTPDVIIDQYILSFS
jgi:hypothetical protein